VHRGDRREHRQHDVDRALHTERPFASDHRGERFAVEKLHRDIRHAVDDAEIIDVDDVRVLEPRGRARLLEKARDRVGVERLVGVEDLQRDALVERRLARLEHSAERPCAELTSKHVRAKRRPLRGRGSTRGWVHDGSPQAITEGTTPERSEEWPDRGLQLRESPPP
jgi:hypothetical protein